MRVLNFQKQTEDNAHATLQCTTLLVKRAVEARDLALVEDVLDKELRPGVDVRFKDAMLIMAAERGDTALIGELLERGASPMAAGGAPVLAAASSGHAASLHALMRGGASLKGAVGTDAMQMAKTAGHQEVIGMLAAHGVKASDPAVKPGPIKPGVATSIIEGLVSADPSAAFRAGLETGSALIASVSRAAVHRALSTPTAPVAAVSTKPVKETVEKSQSAKPVKDRDPAVSRPSVAAATCTV